MHDCGPGCGVLGCDRIGPVNSLEWHKAEQILTRRKGCTPISYAQALPIRNHKHQLLFQNLKLTWLTEIVTIIKPNPELEKRLFTVETELKKSKRANELYDYLLNGPEFNDVDEEEMKKVMRELMEQERTQLEDKSSDKVQEMAN